jgi:glucan 1,4-alpha-glucosidase
LCTVKELVNTAEAIAKAAQHRLAINFHDKPCPMIGVERTYPNAITREYCHAQMDARRVFSPTAFLKTVMTSMIAGPLDMNNGFYALNTDPKTTGRKGWTNTIESTVAAENARVLICSSGLMVLPEAPEEYMKKADLFEFIAEMPQARWDETLVLHSNLTEHISMARRSGREWFVGSVVNERGGTLDIRLDFMESGSLYDVTFYEDRDDSHYQRNKESYRVRKGKMRKGDVVKAAMAPGGGHAMWIRPPRTAGKPGAELMNFPVTVNGKVPSNVYEGPRRPGRPRYQDATAG